MATEMQRDVSVVGPTRRRDRICRWIFCCLPGASLIKRLLLIGTERMAPEYEDESQKFTLARTKSAADLLYPIRMTKLPSMKTSPATYFNDGVSKIDFVLVYEQETDVGVEGSKQLLKQIGMLKKVKFQSIATLRRRETFLLSLKIAGIKMEEDVLAVSSRRAVHFIKLSAPWSVLTSYAELLQLRVPIEMQPELVRNWSSSLFFYLGIDNLLKQNVPGEPINFYTCPFYKNKLKNYLWWDREETFFSTTQRIQVLNEILQTAPYGRTKRAEVGITQLLQEGVFTAAYPIHEGDWSSSKSDDFYNLRHVLYAHWARWGRWYKYQPIHHVRKYFGEKVALYFAFLGFYTSWLSILALFGFVIFILQIYHMFTNPLATMICNSETDYKMCPKCEECSEWYLSDLCPFYKVVAIVDNVAMMFFAIFSSFWTVSFLANWKRTNAVLVYQWSSHEVVWEEQRPRAGFISASPFLRTNPITGRTEPHFPHEQRHYRMVVTSTCMIGMILVVVFSVILMMMFRSFISYHINRSNYSMFSGTMGVIAQETTAATLQFLIIFALGRAYTKMAVTFTEWEMHRTEMEFENALIFKVFVFQFVNYFSPLLYIAFFKDKYTQHPDKPALLFGVEGMPLQRCSGGSCFLEITIQLAIILIAKQTISNVSQILIPKLKNWWQQKLEVAVPLTAQWAKDYYLMEHRGLVAEYLEIVLQFSFVTMFVSAFPLSPLFALLNNWLQIRVDAQKMLRDCRRPVPLPARGLEVWLSILTAVATLSTITNAFVIAFTSDIFPQLIYNLHYGSTLREYLNFTLPFVHPDLRDCRYTNYLDEPGERSNFYWVLTASRLLFVILYEHVIIGTKTVTQMFVPEVPKKLQLRMKRENFMARKAMTEFRSTFDLVGRRASRRRKRRLWSTWHRKNSRPTRDNQSEVRPPSLRLPAESSSSASLLTNVTVHPKE